MRINTPQEKYLNDTFGINDPDLDLVRDRMFLKKVEGMSISAFEARILQFLIRGFGVKKIAEFGTLYGYSALAMAKALPDDGEVVTIEVNLENYTFAQETFRHSIGGDKVFGMCGEADQLMLTIENRGPFDMVFIDADKAGYVGYLNWAEHHVKTGGLIVGDNSLLWGALWDEPTRDKVGQGPIMAMREFNNRLANPNKYNSILIPTVEGLTVAQKL